MSSSATPAAVLMSHLSDHHKAQMTTYLKFARAKRDENVQEVMHEFQDVKDLRLIDDMYARDDVGQIVDALGDVVKTHVSKELDVFAQANATFLRHLFLQAEGHEVQLRVDPNVLHDESLMGAGDKRMDRKAADLPSAPGGKLAPIQGAVDVSLVAKMKEQEESAKRTQERFVKLQAQYLDLQKKNVELKDKLDAAEAAHNSAQAEYLAAIDESNSTKSAHAASASVSAAAAAEIAGLRARVAELDGELATRVNQTRQFQDLKKMMMKKNSQLKEVRARLEKYEPASASAAADDDDSD